VSLQTKYEFTLPRGYVDEHGAVHRTGVMRLATARDELEPLRDPTIQGPEDPRLTVIVLARVVEKLGSLELVTPHEVEGLFAADLAYLQDFYGVINFGTQAEFEAFVGAQGAAEFVSGSPASGSQVGEDSASPTEHGDQGEGSSDAQGRQDGSPVEQGRQARVETPARPGRSAIEEIPAETR
jgi:hypothetical protein